MSHTKQTPILEYTTATLPGDVSGGTIVYNTDESSLNYYNGTDWLTSTVWESTYTTMSTYSAVWNSAPSVFDADAAVYVSSNGNDLFDGRSMDKPRATIREAISVAEDLITAGATGVRIEVLDGSSYGSTTEPAITISDKMHLYAPNATYTGEIEIFGGASVTLDKHISHGPVNPAHVLVAKGSGSCYYKSNLISSGENLHSLLINQGSTTDLYVDVGQMVVKGQGGPAGVLVSDGRVFLNIGSIILESTTSTAGSVQGIYAGNITSTDCFVAGYIGSIKDSSSNISNSNTGIVAFGPSTELYLRVGEIDTTTPYLLTNGSNLYLDCLNIIGTPSGTPNLEISNLTYNNSDWDSNYTTVDTESANWDSTYTTVSANSAAWGAGGDVYDDSLLQSTSGNWDSTYTTVSANSANWGPAGLPEATSTVYVTKDGDSTYDGFSITQAKDTISAAITVASNLITGGATAVNIEILDSSTYTEDIILEDNMILNGSAATLAGTITTDNSSTTHVTLNKHQSATTSTNLVEPGTDGIIVYKANIIDVSSSCRALYTSNSNSLIYADIDLINVGSSSYGVANTQGSIIAKVKWIKLVGNGAIGVSSSGSGIVNVTADDIIEVGPRNATCIDGQAGEMYITTKNLSSNNSPSKVYNIVSATVYIHTIRFVGNIPVSSNEPKFLFTKDNYNNSDWDSNYTTVNTNSASWNSSASAFAYNVGNTNSIEIGAIDTTTQTGANAITIQGTKGLPTDIATAQHAIAIGSNARASGGQNIAVGYNSDATGSSTAVAIGSNAAATQTNTIAIGSGAEASGQWSTSLGYAANASGGEGLALGKNTKVQSNSSSSVGVACQVLGTSSLQSTAMGQGVIVKAAGVSEFGRWQSDTAGGRRGVVRCSGEYSTGVDTDAMVCITTLDSSTAKADGGTADGTEAADTIPRGMHTIRRDGDSIYLDDNDQTGTIKTIELTSTVYTVSTLPTATAGARAFVSDSDATHAAGIGTVVVNTGSGAEFTPVYSDGTDWFIG
jgi:hypothetical protein